MVSLSNGTKRFLTLIINIIVLIYYVALGWCIEIDQNTLKTNSYHYSLAFCNIFQSINVWERVAILVLLVVPLDKNVLPPHVFPVFF